jgi:diguanylate cyclase (GGDEF)-like protein
MLPNEVSILLIEDEPIIRDTLGAILKDEGYNVATAANGAEAISLSKRSFFNVAVIDLKLPDMNGMEVLHNIKLSLRHICAILITAQTTTDSLISAVKAEAYDYITKPFDINHVKLVIKRGVERQLLSDENERLLKNLIIEKKKLEAMLQVSEMMSSILNLDKLVNFIVVKSMEVLEAKRGSIMLLDGNEGQLFIKGAKGLSETIIKDTKVRLGERISGWVAQEGKPLLVADVETDLRIQRKNRPQYITKSFLSVPLKIEDKVTGVVNLTDKLATGEGVFTEEDLKFLTILVQQGAVAIENAKLYKKVSWLAITDALTELFNHRYFQVRLGEEINRAQRYVRPLSLIMLDIDHFKNYNDVNGHLKGNVLLTGIAQILKNNARGVDIISRYGGEEFVIILPETDLADAQAVAEKIRKTVESTSFEGGLSQPEGKVTISGGVAVHRQNITDEQFIMRADEALYKAKQEGRNRICCYEQ